MSGSDPFQSHHGGLDAPATHGAAVTPSDSADLAVVPRALCAQTGGLVKVTLAGSGTVVLPMLAGVPLPVRARRVHASETTVTGLVALW